MARDKQAIDLAARAAMSICLGDLSSIARPVATESHFSSLTGPEYVTVSASSSPLKPTSEKLSSGPWAGLRGGLSWLGQHVFGVSGRLDQAQDEHGAALYQDQAQPIPQYVLDYAPYVHLFSKEEFWPCDLAEHLVHTTPHQNYTPIESMKNDRTLDNLHELNSYGRFTYLTSDDNVEERPHWLGGKQNVPSSPSLSDNDPGGRSDAPAILLVVPKEDGVVDAFWFYFYSYNLGNKVLNVRFGNHVGDWEHSLVRFRNGEPESVSLSEHNFGQAYYYHAVEKIGKRPVIYSAVGSHAMYATPGLHPYVLPWGLLHDETDRGPLWDPRMNMHAYAYNMSTRRITPSTQTPDAPTGWFDYIAHWGDRAYPLDDPRQYRFAGQYHYVHGPLGPRYKSLHREHVCQGGPRTPCVIKHWLGGENEIRDWPGGDTDGDEVWMGGA